MGALCQDCHGPPFTLVYFVAMRSLAGRFLRGMKLPMIVGTVCSQVWSGYHVPQATAAPATPAPIVAALATDPVPHDADDPAIWVDAADPSRSLVIGTDKVEGTGGLYAFGLDGRLRQSIAPLNRPNNVDVEYGFRLGGGLIDIVVATERKERRLRVYRLRPDGSGLEDVSAPGGLSVLAGQTGAAGEPMGIALYRRPRDGAVFAIVSPKAGGATDYLWQYRLEDDGAGRVRGVPVRRFGGFSGRGEAPGVAGEIEAIVVDDELGFVYYADERFGIRKWRADPDAADASRELAVFGLDAYEGDREGLAIYAQPGGKGFILSVDQIPGASRLHVYPREGAEGDPHRHPRLATVPTFVDATDGIDATAAPLPGFPRGVVVMMNSGGRNFLLFPWEAVAARIPGAR